MSKAYIFGSEIGKISTKKNKRRENNLPAT